MVTVTVSTPSNSIVGEESRCGSYRHHHALRPNVHLGGILPHTNAAVYAGGCVTFFTIDQRAVFRSKHVNTSSEPLLSFRAQRGICAGRASPRALLGVTGQQRATGATVVSFRAQRGICAGRQAPALLGVTGPVRPLALLGVTGPGKPPRVARGDRAAACDGCDCRVIPSAARNLRGPGKPPRVARGDRAGKTPRVARGDRAGQAPARCSG
jgi:hypothetical protein